MKSDDWNHFLTLCRSAKNNTELSQILDFFLTYDEKENVIDRLLITKSLLKGKETQREIAENLGVSIAKITRGSNALKTIHSDLRVILQSRLTITEDK